MSEHNGPALILAAHPDDEVLGCGGTIAHLSGQGREVCVAILGEGVTSRSASDAKENNAALETLASSARKAAAILGVNDLRLFGLPDNRFDTLPLLDIVKMIEELVADVRPSTVYVQHGGDLNIDHAILFRAALTALRPVPGSSVRELLGFEVGSSTEWAFQQFAPRFQPNVFQDITNSLETKIKAMNAYVSEYRPSPHPRSAESLRAQAVFRGTQAGVGAAEAFCLIYQRR